jgi:hypothetical protein
MHSDAFNLLLGVDFINATNGRAVPKDRVVLLEGHAYSLPLFTTRAEEKVYEYEAGMTTVSNPLDRPSGEYNSEANHVKDVFYTVTLFGSV